MYFIRHECRSPALVSRVPPQRMKRKPPLEPTAQEWTNQRSSMWTAVEQECQWMIVVCFAENTCWFNVLVAIPKPSWLFLIRVFMILLCESWHQAHHCPLATGLVFSLPVEVAVDGKHTRPIYRERFFCEVKGYSWTVETCLGEFCAGEDMTQH